MQASAKLPGFVHDESQWPLLIVRVPSGGVTNTQLDEFGVSQRAMLERHERYVEVADATATRVILNPKQRRWMAEFIRETHPVAKTYCAGLVIVIHSNILAGGLKAILWLMQPSFPLEVAETLDEAFSIASELARRSGLTLPPQAAEHLLSPPPSEFEGAV